MYDVSGMCVVQAAGDSDQHNVPMADVGTIVRVSEVLWQVLLQTYCAGRYLAELGF
jgi:hypothetical protein